MSATTETDTKSKVLIDGINRTSPTSQSGRKLDTFLWKRATWLLTFVEALLAVHDGNPLSAEAGGPMELAVVLIQPSIWATHGLIVRFTVIQAPALPLDSPMVDHTMASQTTVLVLAWIRVAGMSYKTYRGKKEKNNNYCCCFWDCLF